MKKKTPKPVRAWAIVSESGVFASTGDGLEPYISGRKPPRRAMDLDERAVRVVISPVSAGDQAAEVRRLKRENTRLRKELADFRDFGLRCDTNPTYAGQDKVDGVSDHSWCHGPTWWQRYIDMADKGVRERARAALRGRRGR